MAEKNIAPVWKLPEYLETDRLFMRPFEQKDFASFFAFVRDENATRFMSFTPEQRTLAGAQETFELILQNYGGNNQIFALAVIRRWDNKYIGSLGLYPVENSPDTELFYSLLPKYWGKGYATEASRRLLIYAFSELNLKKILAYIFPHNQASTRVAERLGMKNKGYVLRRQYGSKLQIYSLTSKQFFSR